MPLKNRILVIICAIAIVGMVFFTIDDFITHVKKNETHIVEKNLKVASNNCVSQVVLTLKNYFKVLETMSTMLEQETDLTSKSTLNKLHRIAKENGCVRVSIDFFNGESYTSDGQILNFNDESVMERTVKGESFVSDVQIADEEGKRHDIDFYTPLYDKEQKAFAALKLSVDTYQLSKAIEVTLFDSEGYYHIIDSSGNYVAVENSQNALLMEESFLSAIQKLQYKEGFTAEQILSAFTERSSGYTEYSVEDQQRYAYYEPVGINNWILMMIVPKEVVDHQEQQNIFFATILTLRLAVILAIVFLYVFYIQRQAKKDAVLSDKCFRALAQQAGKIIFEWDFARKELSSNTKFQDRFGRQTDTIKEADDALKTGAVHPDDADTYKQVFDTILSGENVDGARYRIKHQDGTYHWCNLAGVVIKDQKGKPYKAIASLEDINESVCKEEELIQKSEKDQMTGLYNKTTTENLIKTYLEKEKGSKCALMIIDIDNFKQVNDSLGHRYGDKVLKTLAQRIKPLFRADDVVGRIGGDEFFVFLKNYSKQDIVLEKADRICRIFRELSCEENVDCPLSASVGISLFPQHGKDFDILYQNADLALYATKANGKNGFTMYDGSKIGDDFVQKRTMIEN